MAFVSNFAFVKPHSSALAELGERAERYFTDDPNTTLIKLRQLIERLVKELVRVERVHVSHDGKLLDMLHQLYDAGKLEKYPYGLLNKIRRSGNEAVHGLNNRHREAAEQLRNARSLMVWYIGTYGNPDIKIPAFQLPPPPRDASDNLKAALAHQEHLTQQLEASKERQTKYQGLIEQQALRLAQPRVVIRDSLLTHYASLPSAVKTTLKPRLMAFQDNPADFELDTLGGAVDDKLAWVILANDHVMVVARSPEGDVLLCLWIGTYDEATRWAARKRVDVHPELGVLQVYDITPTLAPPAPARFLSALADEDLIGCGSTTGPRSESAAWPSRSSRG